MKTRMQYLLQILAMQKRVSDQQSELEALTDEFKRLHPSPPNFKEWRRAEFIFNRSHLHK